MSREVDKLISELRAGAASNALRRLLIEMLITWRIPHAVVGLNRLLRRHGPS